MAQIQYYREQLAAGVFNLQVSDSEANLIQSKMFNTSTSAATYWYLHWIVDGTDVVTANPSSGFLNASGATITAVEAKVPISRGSSHTVIARCKDAYGHSYDAATRTFTVSGDSDLLSIPTVSYSITTSSVTITLSNIYNSPSKTIDGTDIYPFKTYITWRKKTGSSGDSGWSNDEDVTFNGQSASLSHTYSGLSSGTTYSFKISFSATYDSSQTLQLYKYNITTQSASSPPSISLSYSNKTSTSVDLTVSASSLRTTCYCYLRINGTVDHNYDVRLTSSTLSKTVTVSDLSPSTTYSFFYRGQYSGESDYGDSNILSITTNAAPTVSGTLVFGNYYTGGTAILLRVINATANSSWEWYQKVNGTTTWTYKDTTTANSNGVTSYQFPNLSYGTFYDFKAVCQGSVKSIERINCGPQEASEHQISKFSYQTWTFLVDSVYAIRGNTWTTSTSPSEAPSTLLSYANTRMSGSNSQILTANRMNSLWYNIRAYKSSAIRLPSSWFEAGDKVWATYFYEDIADGIYNMV